MRDRASKVVHEMTDISEVSHRAVHRPLLAVEFRPGTGKVGSQPVEPDTDVGLLRFFFLFLPRKSFRLQTSRSRFSIGLGLFLLSVGQFLFESVLLCLPGSKILKFPFGPLVS